MKKNLPDTGVASLTVCVCCPKESRGGASFISSVTRRGTRSKLELSDAKHNRKQKLHTTVLHGAEFVKFTQNWIR